MRYIYANEEAPAVRDTRQTIDYRGQSVVIDSHLTLDYIKRFGAGIKTFVETGTYRGDTVTLAHASQMFDRIISCELNEELYEAASKKFADRKIIQILLGDTADLLAQLAPTLDRTMFFLDAHASGPLAGGKSGGTPVLDELRAIQSSGRDDHTIFIDDRRLFGSDEWSGVQEQQAMDIIRQINPGYKIEYLDGYQPGDLICAHV